MSGSSIRKLKAPIVLDTNTFDRKDFLNWLKFYREEKNLPAVAYAELYVYFVGEKKQTQEGLDYLLRRLDIKFHHLGKTHCVFGGEIGLERGDFEKHCRDYLIAGHAYNPPYIVITENIKDFDFLGDRVMTVDEAMSKLHCIKR